MASIKKIGVKGFLTVWHRQLTFRGMTCIKCKRTMTFDSFALDRIVPGTIYNANNVQLVCMTCNAFRRDADASKFYGTEFANIERELSTAFSDVELKETANTLRKMHNEFYSLFDVESQTTRELNKVKKYR